LRKAMAYLRSAPPLPPLLRVSAGMSAAAREHVKDSGRRGSLGHAGSDGSTSAQRMGRHGRFRRGSAENINYSVATDARQTVLQMLIDDGVPSRAHRRNIFNPDFTVIGVAGGRHKTHRFMVVVNFAGDFEESESSVVRGGAATVAEVGKSAPPLADFAAPEPAALRKRHYL